MPSTDQPPAEPYAVELKDPILAAFLAWLMPGLGHLYQGRPAKAGLFFVCVMGTFLYGLYLGSDLHPTETRDLGIGRDVYFMWKPGAKRLAYLCQVGVGLPALPALIQANRMDRHKPVFLHGLMAPPRLGPLPDNDPNHKQPTEDELNYYLHPYLDLGKSYTMIAGLLNVLAIYDALAGPVFTATGKKDDEDEGGEGNDEDEAASTQEAGKADVVGEDRPEAEASTTAS